jgi:predicted nucleic acid-binding Zn ribbon protein
MERMRDVLRGSLARSLSAMREEDRLAAAWPVACGKAMAEHGEMVGLEDGVLRIAVSDTAWLAQMRSMQPMLEREMARISGVGLGGIHFELKR